MKNKLKIFGIIIGFIILSYIMVWMESYNRSRDYYIVAMENYNKGDYVTALKGKRVLKEDQSGYVYLGGFQQALEIWDSPYAFPRSKIYKLSQKMINKIIDEKIDIEMGQKAFRAYFNMDNRFLPEILIRVGELQLKGNQIDKAKETFKIVKEAFVRYKNAVEIADKKLREIEKMKTQK